MDLKPRVARATLGFALALIVAGSRPAQSANDWPISKLRIIKTQWSSWITRFFAMDDANQLIYVRVIDQDTGIELASFIPYESSYVGGARVAVGDLTGDGVDEIIVAPGRSRAPEVRVFSQTGVELTQYRTLASYRSRIRRVVYYVHIVRGDWTLQQAADYKRSAEPGKGRIDEDIMRSIHWPTQLISYFTGKQQLMDLRRDYRKKLGAAYSERAFHDAVLAEGSIPVALIRAKLLGEPLPAP